ncbi:GNAT family N-acetyltransferase [Pedobacter caeni]|uniref:Ribosomal-protein-alanine N-acetyltransferase n=1 Tax=Pedobacter caeni TaxID=288992 RepID=A0A1M4UHZ4_9SPHI|nr:GNAT family protein [Pedobacter caeni]SHE56180.1 ribosomal-protein-alanine N-acetyltransferase [Pedobacter caeni]
MQLPPYHTFPDIRGDKVSLRQIQPADVHDIIEISFYDAVQANSWQQAIAMQDKINMDYVEGNSIHWGIAERVTNKIIGTCGYYRGLDKGSGELGFVLLPQYQGQGYMSASIALAIDFGINEIGLKRIWAETSKGNENAIKLLERLNFIKVAELEDDGIEYELIGFPQRLII